MLFELSFDRGSDIFADGIEISWRVLLTRNEFFFDNGLNELSSLGGSELLSMLGFDLILAGTVCRFFWHLN